MNDSIRLNLSIPELNLVLEALGVMPYYKVYELIGRLQTGAQEQLNSAPGQPIQPAAEQQRTATHAGNGVHAGE